MATRKPGKPRNETPPGQDRLAQVYRAGPPEQPPAALDEKILAAAREAVATAATPRRPRSYWLAPLATAAVVVLSLGVVLLLSEQGELNHGGNGYPVPVEAPSAPPAMLAEKATEPPAPAAAARPKAASPAASTVGVASLPSVPLTDAIETKKSEAGITARSAPAAAEVPVRTQRLEADRARMEASEPETLAGTLTREKRMRNQADVQAVKASGAPGAYQFSVTIKSPDTGCQQYADWWEVVSEDGRLLYRRVLLHSHVDEQPFTRSGGPVPVQPDTIVWVRAHMNHSGYGGAALKGSVRGGFSVAMPPPGFAAGLASQAPLPEGCDF